MSTVPTRVDGDLWEAAKASGATENRSAAQQISHWARIGRELESSPGVSHRDIVRVLQGAGSYDDLSEREQAVVRAAWEERFAERRESLDLAAEFTSQGESWSEVDEHGRIVLRGHDLGAS